MNPKPFWGSHVVPKVMAFAACWHVYLMNLMVAQLCQRYNEIFHDARGNARLTRGINIYETSMPLISKKRWKAFVDSLHLTLSSRASFCLLEGPRAIFA